MGYVKIIKEYFVPGRSNSISPGCVALVSRIALRNPVKCGTVHPGRDLCSVSLLAYRQAG